MGASPPGQTSPAHAIVTSGTGPRGRRIGVTSCVPELYAPQWLEIGQSSHLGTRGRQIRAPSSISAWLKPPGSTGSTRTPAHSSSTRSVGSRLVHETREHPPCITVHRAHRESVGDGSHRSSRIGTDARERAEFAERRGNATAVMTHDLAGRPAKAKRTGIVAKPLPRLQYLLLCGPGECGNRREPPHPPLEVGRDRAGPRLLQHHLGDENAVRVPVRPPREVTTVAPEVVEEGRAERPHGA